MRGTKAPLPFWQAEGLLLTSLPSYWSWIKKKFRIWSLSQLHSSQMNMQLFYLFFLEAPQSTNRAGPYEERQWFWLRGLTAKAVPGRRNVPPTGLAEGTIADPVPTLLSPPSAELARRVWIGGCLAWQGDLEKLMIELLNGKVVLLTGSFGPRVSWNSKKAGVTRWGEEGGKKIVWKSPVHK